MAGAPFLWFDGTFSRQSHDWPVLGLSGRNAAR
jgi:hypothetical protein